MIEQPTLIAPQTTEQEYFAMNGILLDLTRLQRRKAVKATGPLNAQASPVNPELVHALAQPLSLALPGWLDSPTQ